MRIINITRQALFAAAALVGVTASTQAASVSLVYVGSNDIAQDDAILAEVGDTLTFELVMDFTDRPTLGGGFDITFDSSALQFVSYDSAGLGEPAFGRDPDVEDGRLASGAVGAFAGLTEGLIATISFTFLGGPPGDYNITPGGTQGIGGPWISSEDFFTIEPDYFGATVRVIPVPAAVWFLLSGLVALAGVGRRALPGKSV